MDELRFIFYAATLSFATSWAYPLSKNVIEPSALFSTSGARFPPKTYCCRIRLKLRGGEGEDDSNLVVNEIDTKNRDPFSANETIDSGSSSTKRSDSPLAEDESLSEKELLALGRQSLDCKDFSGAATYLSQLVQRQAQIISFDSLSLENILASIPSHGLQRVDIRVCLHNRRCRGTVSCRNTVPRATSCMARLWLWKLSRCFGARTRGAALARESMRANALHAPLTLTLEA